MKGCPVLIFANKQDLEGALTEKEIIEGLALDQETIMNGRAWRIQKSCALEGKGLWEGLDWLVRTCKK